MAKKILETLTDNLLFKLLAVVFAFALWLVVYNIDDPIKQKSFTTYVSIENADSVAQMGKYYEILDGTNCVTFSVSAKRTILNTLQDSDFSATADFSNLVLDENGESASVPIRIKCTRVSESNLKYSGEAKTMLLSLENLMNKRFTITPEIKGTVANGYAVGSVSISGTNIVKVSGPASIVEQISGVVATLDVDDMSQNLSDNVVPMLRDKDGNEVDSTKLTLSVSTVTISATILGKKEVPLNLETKGTPAKDYSVVGITANPDKLWIKGASNVLNPISAINVPADVLDVSGLRSNLTTTIDVTEYLPDGIELVDNTEATVEVKVEIEPYQSRDFFLPSSNITIEGLSDEEQLAFSHGNIQVTISGMTSNLNQISGATIHGTIDVTGMSPGTHTVNITLDLDEHLYVVTSAKTQIVITKKGADNTGNSTIPDDGTATPSDRNDNSEDTE